MSNQIPENGMERILAAKRARRKELAKQPIEEKVRILIELQKIALQLHPPEEGDWRRVWELSE